MVEIHRQWRSEERQELARIVLAVLPGPADDPRSTPDIRRHQQFASLDPYEQDVYISGALRNLASAGLAEKTKYPGDHRAFWRRTRAGENRRRA